MTRLYVSTDAFEAECLIDPEETKDYVYHDIDIEHGLELEKRAGFNPMCSVEFNGKTPIRAIEQMAIDMLIKDYSQL